MEQGDASNPVWLILGILVGFVVVFPLFWCGVVALLGFVGGWRSLAKHYRAGNRPVSGIRANPARSMIGFVSYRNIIAIHFTPEGFFLETMPLFRVGHPRLFIPWADVVGRKRTRWFFYTSESLLIGDPKVGLITLPAKLMDAHGPSPAQSE